MLRADFPNALLGSDKASAQHTVPVIEYRRLPGGNSRSLHGKSYQQIAVLRQLDDLTRNRAASVPDAHRKIRACQKLLYIRSHGRFCQHVFGSQLIGISQHDRVLLGINFQYVCRLNPLCCPNFTPLLSTNHPGPIRSSISGQCSRRNSR